ncbi:MAG: ATP-grasp domain-containing protein [Dehalococcoidales bacterium]|nr:ATP-grasp domain-containing protein [Dehalococcoidales bacterium]
MDRQNVLIPGAGGAAGLGAIKSLRLCGFEGRIVATDANALSSGLYLADCSYVVPFADNYSFITEATKIIENERIDTIMPTSGSDLIPYSKNKKSIEEKGIIVAMSDYQVIESCLDKLRFYHQLKNKFNLPYTTTDQSEINAFPCIVKPIWGKGSKNVFTCHSKANLENILLKNHDMVIQEYLPGKEYSIDVLSDLEGKPLLAIPRERIEVKAGISFKSRIVLDNVIAKECLRIAECLSIKGPSCVQMRCDKKGKPRVVEVNPRIGGGTILTTYAGVNFPELVLAMASASSYKIPKLKELKEITMLRYYEEVILDAKGRVMKL